MDVGRYDKFLVVEPGKTLAHLVREKRRKEISKWYKWVAGQSGYSVEYVKRVAQVSRRIPKSERHPELTFDHYESLLASIGNPSREKWALRAVKRGWSAEKLHEEFHNAPFNELGRMPVEKTEVDDDIGKPSKADEELEKDLETIPQGISYEDVKKAINENIVSTFDIVFDATQYAMKNASSFVEGESEQRIRMLINRLRKLAKILGEAVTE